MLWTGAGMSRMVIRTLIETTERGIGALARIDPAR
jgi:hypothetical protein